MDYNEVEILLAEDSMPDAEMTIYALKKAHLANNLVHVQDGAEALDFLFCRGEYEGRNKANTPKVILLDIKMPKVDGIEVLRHLKSDPRTKMIPVVILTSSNDDPNIKRCYELGANSYIVKPVELNNFVKTISEIGMYWLVIDKGV